MMTNKMKRVEILVKDKKARFQPGDKGIIVTSEGDDYFYQYGVFVERIEEILYFARREVKVLK
jgi:hypothetical protein